MLPQVWTGGVTTGTDWKTGVGQQEGVKGKFCQAEPGKPLQSLGSPSHLDLCRGLPSALPASAPYTFHRVSMWGLKGPFENVSDDITPLL